MKCFCFLARFSSLDNCAKTEAKLNMAAIENGLDMEDSGKSVFNTCFHCPLMNNDLLVIFFFLMIWLQYMNPLSIVQKVHFGQNSYLVSFSWFWLSKHACVSWHYHLFVWALLVLFSIPIDNLKDAWNILLRWDDEIT